MPTRSCSGSYPSDILDLFKPLLPIKTEDLKQIYQPLNFVGLNLYNRVFAQHDPKVPLLQAMAAWNHRVPSSEYTDMGWEIHPQSISETLLRLKNDWGDPVIYVTENGAAFNDRVEGGKVNDQRRIEYLKKYLREVK